MTNVGNVGDNYDIDYDDDGNENCVLVSWLCSGVVDKQTDKQTNKLMTMMT